MTEAEILQSILESLQSQSTLITQSTDTLLNAVYWLAVICASTMFFCCCICCVCAAALFGGRE